MESHTVFFYQDRSGCVIIEPRLESRQCSLIESMHRGYAKTSTVLLVVDVMLSFVHSILKNSLIMFLFEDELIYTVKENSPLFHPG